MNRPQKNRRNPYIKTKTVKKLDGSHSPARQKLNGNYLEIPRRRKNDQEPANPKPAAPFPEKGSPVWFVIVILSLFLYLPNAAAQTYTLTSGNSSVSIDSSSQAGLDGWQVDGQNQLNTQSFWYRTGSAGTAASIDTISAASLSQAAAGLLLVGYQNSQFSVQVSYSLVGGAIGSGTADLAEQISIHNLTRAALTFDLFQFSDFALGGGSDQNAQLSQNSHGLFNEALVTSPNPAANESIDMAVSPGANRGEVALGNSTLDNLQNTAGYHLDNTADAGPGNAASTLEWDNTVAAHGEFIISEDVNIAGVTVTPASEPPVWALISAGLLVFRVMRRQHGLRA